MRKNLAYFGISFFWVFLACLIFVTSLKDSIILSQHTKQNIQYLFPQGWAFFTKDPKESLVDIYRVNGNRLEPVEISNVMTDNLAGFSRRARVMGYELSMVVSTFRPEAWKANTLADFSQHINDTTFKVKTKVPYKYFNSGTYLLRQRMPVPWAWSGTGQENFAPYKTLKVQIN